ncbi:glutamate ligase domain-containing protein [Microcella sp.]|uniref:glutamate ligase domain-containing protein n=1 Tax=Microcella sp. TaxID=1913979 RepID=UPI003919C07F
MAVTVDDVIASRAGTVLSLRHGEERAEVTIDALGEVAVDAAIRAIDDRIADGATLADALEAAASIRDVPRRCARLTAPDDILVIDDRGAVTPAEVRRSLQVLAGLTRGTAARSFAVVGELETEPADWFEAHDALGRIVVRLDVSQLIVIGHGARHLHNAAGLEGSWDGESLLVDTADEAYAGLRDRVRAGDTVLVTGGGRTDLTPIVDRLIGAVT